MQQTWSISARLTQCLLSLVHMPVREKKLCEPGRCVWEGFEEAGEGGARRC